jgi:rhodanese-related sulfurtransferase
MKAITVQALHARLKEESPLILDVREPDEFAICRIEGSINIPMNQIPSRLRELELEQPIVVVCHHGVRSRVVGDYLKTTGYQDITNLIGGVDTWAREVDPSMPRY